MGDMPYDAGATSRTVSIGEDGVRAVFLRRRYGTPVEDLWDACTSPERIARWLSPVTGDLRLGGTYQLAGNAGGSITACQPPRLLRVTWVLGDAAPTDVELRLSPDGSHGTLLELQHSGPVDPAFWAQFGPGAVGVGWDLVLLGLLLHLSGQPKPDPGAWAASPEGREFVVLTSSAWGAASEAAGTPPGDAAAAAERTTAFYTPPPAAPEDPAT